MPNVQILNTSTLITAAQLAPIVAALQTQLTRDFGPVYGIEAQVALAAADDGTSWPIHVIDSEADAPPGALAWHTVDSAGRPYGIIPMATVQQYGEDPAPTIGHELLEMLADPQCDAVKDAVYPPVVKRGKRKRTAEIAYEVCDPVENDSYDIDGVAMTNFVLPPWFADEAAEQFDFLRKLTGPLTIDAGGYMQYSYDGRNWQQVEDQLKPRKQNPGYHSRACRRVRARFEKAHPGHHAHVANLESMIADRRHLAIPQLIEHLRCMLQIAA